MIDPAAPAREVIPQLVDAIRMLTRAEMMDHSGHGSARRDERSFYINSGASVRGSLTERDIVAVDFEGALLEGTAKPPLEFPLHAESTVHGRTSTRSCTPTPSGPRS